MTTATTAQLAAASAHLHARMVAGTVGAYPTLREAGESATAAGIELYGAWHLNRIIAGAQRLDLECFLAEIRGE